MDEQFHESVAGGSVTPYLVDLVQGKQLTPGKTLELGSANGANAVYLASLDFDVLGIDISETSVKFARENAKKSKLDISFLAADASNLSFLKDMYDVILDWGAFHAINPDRRDDYVTQLIEHMSQGARLVLRVYSKRDTEAGVDAEMDLGRKRYFFSEDDIKRIFGKSFKVLERKEDDVQVGPVTSSFDYYLLEKQW